MQQGQKRGIPIAYTADLTVWMIWYISPYDYMLSLDLKLLLSYNFGCEI